jgi:hypothetical protein
MLTASTLTQNLQVYFLLAYQCHSFADQAQRSLNISCRVGSTRSLSLALGLQAHMVHARCLARGGPRLPVGDWRWCAQNASLYNNLCAAAAGVLGCGRVQRVCA